MQNKKITWTQVKARISQLDHRELVELIRDLYVTHQGNRTFLHTRYGLAGNSLELYKNVISRWMWPDPFSHDNPSVAKAKQAVAAYKHAGRSKRPRRVDDLLLRTRDWVLRGPGI